MAFVDLTTILGLGYLEEREKIVLRKLRKQSASSNNPKTAQELNLTRQDMQTMKHLINSGLAAKTDNGKYYITDKGLKKVA